LQGLNHELHPDLRDAALSVSSDGTDPFQQTLGKLAEGNDMSRMQRKKVSKAYWPRN